MIDPHLPKEIKHAKVVRVFRGVKYNISITNNSSGKYQMTIDNKSIDGKIIPYNKDLTEVNVNITL
jgi:cellobiose phosphorylase